MNNIDEKIITLHCKDFKYLPKKSHYNYNYFKNIKTGDIWLEICHEDIDYEYYNLGKNPDYNNRYLDHDKWVGNTLNDDYGLPLNKKDLFYNETLEISKKFI